MPAQLSNSQSAAESDRGDGKPTTPQYRSNLIIEKEKRLSGCLTSPASPHDEASGFPQAIPKDEVGPAETRYSSPIPSIHSDQLISSGSRQATTKPDKDFRQGLRSRPNSLSSGTSDSNSESYKYATDKSKLALDHLHSEHLVTFDGLTDAKYPHAFTSNPTGRSPEHDATSSSADPGLSDRDTTTPFRSVMPELATFFSPKSGVVSESSHMPTTPPSSSNSFVPDHPEPTSLRQPQVVSVVQEGSILNPMINTLADEAMEGYELGRLNNFTTFANTPSTPPPSSIAEELEIRFIALINIKSAVLLRQLAVATDIGIALELLMPKLCLYVKDETTLTSVYEEIKSIKQECLDRQLDIRFHALEYLSSITSPHNPSLQSKIEALQREIQPLLDKYKASRDAALQFVVDPSALIENRLVMFSTAQR